jgi:hypothetical protein
MVSICIVGSFLVMYFSRGGIFWSTIDDWVGTFLIFVLAMVQIILFSWVFGVDRGMRGGAPRRPDPHSALLPLHHEVRDADLPRRHLRRLLLEQPAGLGAVGARRAAASRVRWR